MFVRAFLQEDYCYWEIEDYIFKYFETDFNQHLCFIEFYIEELECNINMLKLIPYLDFIQIFKQLGNLKIEITFNQLDYNFAFIFGPLNELGERFRCQLLLENGSVSGE